MKNICADLRGYLRRKAYSKDSNVSAVHSLWPSESKNVDMTNSKKVAYAAIWPTCYCITLGRHMYYYNTSTDVLIFHMSIFANYGDLAVHFKPRLSAYIRRYSLGLPKTTPTKRRLQLTHSSVREQLSRRTE